MKKALLGALLPLTAFAQQQGPAVRLQTDAVITLPAGAGLAAIADGDFNHDNRRDLAVCERNLGQVALYMRSVAGTYPAAKYTYAVGTQPSGLVSFNRTPSQAYHTDLMALSGPSSQWTLLRDDLDTTGFLTRRVLTPGFGTGAPSPRPVLQLLGVDNNNQPLFAYTYPGGFNSFIRYDYYYSDTYRPSPLRQFDTPHFNLANNRASNLTLADFNLDGTLDQVTADSSQNTVHVTSRWVQTLAYLQNNGRGPVSTSAQDIDNDLLADLAIAYAGSNEVMLLRTMPNAQFVFNRAYSYAMPASPRRVLLTDLNRDLRPEMLVVTADNQLRVYQHDGTGTSFSYASIPPQVLATGVDPNLLQVTDLNGDNYPDVIVGCVGDNTVHTYLNRSGTATATRARQPLADVDIFPTRATDQVTVRQVTARPLTATLLDEVGRSVQQQTLTQTTSVLTTQGLPRGIYLLQLSGDAGTRTTRLVLQ